MLGERPLRYLERSQVLACRGGPDRERVRSDKPVAPANLGRVETRCEPLVYALWDDRDPLRRRTEKLDKLVAGELRDGYDQPRPCGDQRQNPTLVGDVEARVSRWVPERSG